MPVRKTKRGDERTPLEGSWDVVICGASFAGLTVARELSGSGARVLLLDRYEIGERQTSACAAPTDWLDALDLAPSIKQTFGELVVHTPHATTRMELPWTFSTFDYQHLCSLLWESCDAEFETAKIERRVGSIPAPGSADDGAPVSIETDRGIVEAPLVVDCLGWRRVLDDGYQPPDAPLSRGLEVHPGGEDDDLAIWIDRDVVPAGYGWSFPASDELRIGIGSFDPRFHVKDPTVKLAADLGKPPGGYQGNWIPHRLREGASRGIFFCGDSAGHCLPLTAEGIRPAFYFGTACARELRSVFDGRIDRGEALQRYSRFNSRHRWKFEWMLRVQRLVPRVPPRLLALALRVMGSEAFVTWSFNHYLNVAGPGIVAKSEEQRQAVPA